MGPKERREREREEIRSVILDAARELFVQDGYESVSMRKIADRIEYSPTAIYFHFKDKEALLKEICAHDFLALAHDMAALQQVADPIERLRGAGHAYIEFGVRNPNHYRLMFMTPHPPVDPSDDLGVQKGNPEEDAYEFVKHIAAEGVAAGRFRDGLTDIELIAQTVWAGVHGVISLQIAKCNDAWVDWRPLEVRAKTMVDALIDGMTVPAAAAKPARKKK